MNVKMLHPAAVQSQDPFVQTQWEVIRRDKTDGDIFMVFWQIQEQLCNWNIRVVPENYTLHPYQNPKDVPIEKGTEFNITFERDPCSPETGSQYQVNVTLYLLLNDNVMEHVPYIVCKISRWTIDDMRVVNSSMRVYLPTTPLTTPATSDHSTIYDVSTSPSIQETEASSNSTSEYVTTCSANSRHYNEINFTLAIAFLLIARFMCCLS